MNQCKLTWKKITSIVEILYMQQNIQKKAVWQEYLHAYSKISTDDKTQNLVAYIT